MQIVIEMADAVYNKIVSKESEDCSPELAEIIRKGVVLPKFHGPIKDVRDFISDAFCSDSSGGDCWGDCSKCRERAVSVLDIESAPVLIERNDEMHIIQK